MASFAIVPAAGQSARMGRSKLLLPWQARAGASLPVHARIIEGGANKSKHALHHRLGIVALG